MRSVILNIAALTICTSTCLAAETAPSYEQHVAPILKKYCVGCHNSTELDGEFSLESFADLQKGGPRCSPAIRNRAA